MSFLRKYWGIIPVVFLCILAVGCWAQFRQTQLASRMIRLHVVANSDGEADQALKLQVRDAVLAQCQETLGEADSLLSAREKIVQELPALAETGRAVVQAEGYSYPVSVTLEYTGFPKTDYEDFSLPAGEYQALRVVIGSGQGHNWWCVLFPSLCLGPVSELAETAMTDGLTEEDVALITRENQDYELRFQCIELWEELLGKLREKSKEIP